jgi:iron complex outermembrane receptor protein
MGFRSNLFDGVLAFNLSAFRYWYENYQVYHVVNEPGSIPTNQLLSADTRVVGFEADFRFSPNWWVFEGLTVTGGLGWNDSEFVDFQISKVIEAGQRNPQRAPRSIDFDFSGHSLIASPEWNGSGVISWQIPIRQYGFITPGFDFSYKSKVYLDPTSEEALSQDPYWLFNARLAYMTADETFEVAFWVRNIWKKEHKEDAFDVTRTEGIIAESWAEPRTYGVSLSVGW